MRRVLADIRAVLAGEANADRVVPPQGFTAQLTVLTSAAMAFLMVFALALSLASGRLASSWSAALSQGATLRLSAPADQMAAQTAVALAVLQTTPGVASARALSADEQRALLAPWFGPDLPLEELPVPQLIEITEDRGGFDAAGLRLRLSAEVPGAVLDDHARWRKPLVRAARVLRVLGWVSIALMAAASAAMITLAANAALSANAQVIAVLRQVGATDGYIARAFVRRFTFRALSGAGIGLVAGAVAVLLLPSSGAETTFLTGLGFRGWHWLVALLIPPALGAVAFWSTSVAARRMLEGLR
ncbi:cell division protein FtsX [Pseudaestuariivita sp.]|uniref:cell division protein FtsX n=1 Tax=Pseudaestuariivita sp. TaxID=2211669 RepID=UPI004059EF81